jgi:hypothetical protein
MDRYLLWFDVEDTRRDLEFAAALRAWCEHLRSEGLIRGWSLTRRKLGFGPAELGEFCAELQVRDLAQLEAAFQRVAARSGPGEDLHRAVYARVRNLRTALYRDFPDPQRA